MKTIACSVLLICTCALGIAETLDVENGGGPGERQDTYVLVVGGISRDPNEREAKDKAVMRLRKFFLEEVKVASSRVSVLVDDRSSVRKDSKKSTAENLKMELDALAGAIKPTDRFIFYYVGQANVVVETLRLNLPGKDITHKELGKWINRIKASSMLVVLDCPGAGLSAKAIKGEGRIVVCGSRDDQRYSTRFSRYFVPALVDIKSDSDGDSRVSLLEAFTRASRQVDDFYRKQKLLTTETPVLEDNGDGVPSQQPWKYEEDEKDGLAASNFFFIDK
ncbi:MAG: hypothetical protein ACYS8I_05830 [Planctomycetota bacterium]